MAAAASAINGVVFNAERNEDFPEMLSHSRDASTHRFFLRFERTGAKGA